jgi:hypothetical protein
MQTMMLLLLAASPVQADLQAMEQSDGAAYLAARARVISAGALAEVEARRAESKYDAGTWRSDVIADAAHFWLTRAAEAERVYALEGLDPTKYRRRRRPAPEAGRELARSNADPILFELLLKTMDRYPLATDEERIALEEAVIVALGRSSHPAAPLALLETARDRGRRASSRGLAAAQLRAEESLSALLADETFEVRYGAVRGLGEVRTPSSVRALIAASKDRELRLAAIRALGTVASPFVLARSGNVHAEEIRSEASRAIVSMLLAEGSPAHADALVETLAVIRHRSALDELARVEQTELIARARRRLERVLRR